MKLAVVDALLHESSGKFRYDTSLVNEQLHSPSSLAYNASSTIAPLDTKIKFPRL